MNCEKSEFGICKKCQENYYLTKNNECVKYKNCLHSENYSCKECDDGFYFYVLANSCVKEEDDDNIKNCKITTSGYKKKECAECKNNYYLSYNININFSNCYSNKNKGPFYKCKFSNENDTECSECINDFYLSSEDHFCSLTENWTITENNKCVQCNENYCLDVENEKCIKNNLYMFDNDKEKNFYKCLRTNKDGNKCEICESDYSLNENGICIDNIHCKEKNKNGICIECENSNNKNYCLNNNFGCVENLNNNNWYRCDNDSNLNDCTECSDGFKLVENNDIEGEFYCEHIE